MSVENLLQHFKGVKRIGKDKWKACCSFHDDRNASMVIRELDDGRILIHCFAGCSAAEILDAVGLDWSALYPPRIGGDYLPRVRKPWNASDVLGCLAFDALVVLQCANAVRQGVSLTDADHARLVAAASHFQAGEGIANA